MVHPEMNYIIWTLVVMNIPRIFFSFYVLRVHSWFHKWLYITLNIEEAFETLQKRKHNNIILKKWGKSDYVLYTAIDFIQ